MELIADSALVIDLERERARGAAGRAHGLLQAHLDDRFFITFTVAGELACGDSAEHEAEWRRLCAPYGVIEWSEDISFAYGALYRLLKSRGQMIGTNDLWIAATAVRKAMPVVTRNKSDFERIPDLRVLTY